MNLASRATRQMLILFTMCSACSLVHAGEIADMYARVNKTPTPPQPWPATVRTNHGITEIGIERTPFYTFFITGDGKFRYRYLSGVERKGKVRKLTDFHKLAQFIRDCDYAHFADDYDMAIDHAETTFTTVVIDGQRKVVRNRAEAGPLKLWIIERLIRDMARDLFPKRIDELQ